MGNVRIRRDFFRMSIEKVSGAKCAGYFLCFCSMAILCLSTAFGQKQTAVFEGIEVGFEMEHEIPGMPKDLFKEGDYVRFRFTISNTLTGEGISGASPGAWMEPAGDNSRGELFDCGQLITSFLGGSMFSRAELDLNVFYVLALNDDPSISVVDPLFSFGGTQLLAIVELESVGMDWVVGPDQNHLFVSQPEAGKVAMVSCTDWKVEKQISLNATPNSLALQPDGHFVWVDFHSTKIEGFSGVAAISTSDGTLAASIPTGEGDHEIAISDNGRWVFVTNTQSQTVSVVDPNGLKKLKDIPLNGTPGPIAWSSQAQAAYVVNPETGMIQVIDGRSQQTITEVEGLKGAAQIVFEPTGRYAFLVYPDLDRMQILDAASNRIVQTGDTEKRPVAFAFSDELAYLTHAESETVLMVPLDQIGKEGTPIQAADFPGGQEAPGFSRLPSKGPGMIQAPGASAMLLANPKDKTVYYYMEGMAAPMGNFSNYNREPRSVAVIDRSLNEASPGVYETVARLRGFGPYRLPFFLDAPRIVHCFKAAVQKDPVAEAKRMEEKLGTVSVELFREKKSAVSGEEIAVYAKMIDPVSGEVLTGLEDVKLRATSTNNWASEMDVPEAEIQGLYGGYFNFPRAGVYYIYAECQSRKLTFDNPQYMILKVDAKP